MGEVEQGILLVDEGFDLLPVEDICIALPDGIEQVTHVPFLFRQEERNGIQAQKLEIVAQ